MLFDNHSVDSNDDGSGAYTFREFLRQNRGDLLREVKRILDVQGQMLSETQEMPTGLRIVITYNFSTTNLDVHLDPEVEEEIAKPTTQPPSDLKRERDKTSNIVRSTTPTHNLPRQNASATAPSMANPFLSSHNSIPLSDETTKYRQSAQPKPFLKPIRQTNTSQSAIPPKSATGPAAEAAVAPLRAKPPVVRKTRFGIDKETGAMLLWKDSYVPWHPPCTPFSKTIKVRLPPRTFTAYTGTFHAGPRSKRALACRDEIAPDVVEMQDMLRALENSNEVDIC